MTCQKQFLDLTKISLYRTFMGEHPVLLSEIFPKDDKINAFYSLLSSSFFTALNNTMVARLCFTLLLFALLHDYVESFGCKDRDGKDVKWWLARKVPNTWDYYCILCFFRDFLYFIFWFLLLFVLE